MPPEAQQGALADILDLCATGAIPPNIALMQLVGEARDPQEGRQALAAALGQPGDDGDRKRRLQAVLHLWDSNPSAWDMIKGVLGNIAQTEDSGSERETVSRIAEGFDQAARLSPEGSVALYSLGSSDLLDRASSEIATCLREWGLAGTGRRCLDLGCGIGRMAWTLAPDFGEIVGVDISAEMLRNARERCAGLANTRFEQVSGRDLAGFADAQFDLVLAVDSFPYLFEAGPELAGRMVQEAARVLKAGGTFLIFNFSYRGNPEADAADAARFAKDAGLVLTEAPPPEFRYWDGQAFRMDKPA